MPLYQFECETCGIQFELSQKVDAEMPECPKCQKPTKKIVSLSTFHLKGGGWAADGYCSGGSE